MTRATCRGRTAAVRWTGQDVGPRENQMPTVTAAATGRPAYSLSDDLVEPAETRDVTYRCPSGHTFVARFFAGAEVVPHRWACRSCDADAHTDDPAAEEVPDSRRWVGRTKTPWQMLLERRTLAELEALLDERLRLLRAAGEAA
jgi:hypothetical protein